MLPNYLKWKHLKEWLHSIKKQVMRKCRKKYSREYFLQLKRRCNYKVNQCNWVTERNWVKIDLHIIMPFDECPKKRQNIFHIIVFIWLSSILRYGNIRKTRTWRSIEWLFGEYSKRFLNIFKWICLFSSVISATVVNDVKGK